MEETKRSEKVRREKESKKKRGSGYLYKVGGENIFFFFFLGHGCLYHFCTFNSIVNDCRAKQAISNCIL